MRRRGRPRASATTSTKGLASLRTSSVPSRAPGRRLCTRIASTTSRKTVTRSTSQKVNTVSRCIAPRDFGICAAITRLAAPRANSDRANWLTACGDVRSPMPTSTTPLPMGITSPPSSEASPWSMSGLPQPSGARPAKAG